MSGAASRSPPLTSDLLLDRKLVIFDVDGTLYDQARLRRAMAMRLLAHLAATGRLSTLRALRAYRHAREATAETEDPAFEATALASAARAGAFDAGEARDLVDEWMHRRPLDLLAGCRYAGVAELFSELRRRSTTVAVLSDYPAAGKLRAMDLRADRIAHAGSPEVPVQKPHPCGIRHLMEVSGATPAETILIGDRDERDGEAARRAGIDVLIRTDRPAGAGTFRSFAALAQPARRRA